MRPDRGGGAAAEETLTARISARLTVESIERIVALVAGADQEDDAEPGGAGGGEGEDGPPVLGKIKEAPGNRLDLAAVQLPGPRVPTDAADQQSYERA